MAGAVVREAVAAVAALLAAHDALAACDIDLLTATELLEVGDGVDTVTRELPTQSHRLLARLQVETTATALGAKSCKDVLAIRWRISTREAHRRLTEAALLGPRRSLTGEPLPPVLEATAAAAAHGLITAEHVDIIRKAITKIPSFVDAATPPRSKSTGPASRSRSDPRNCLTGSTCGCSCSTRTAPSPTTPNAPASVASPGVGKAATPPVRSPGG